MSHVHGFTTVSLLAAALTAGAQLPNQIQLNIQPSNRTLSVSAEERVTADPEIAILHIGFETPPSDAKTAYSLGAKTSNDIVSALKQAGVPEASIRSESQHLSSFDYKSRRFKLVQQWTVKTEPARAAEILQIAIAAGADESGEIEWTVKDVRALEDRALGQATARAKEDATALATGMGTHLSGLLFVTNQVTKLLPSIGMALANNADGLSYEEKARSATAPLSIEPRKVSRTASVYAVFAIE